MTMKNSFISAMRASASSGLVNRFNKQISKLSELKVQYYMLVLTHLFLGRQFNTHVKINHASLNVTEEPEQQSVII